MSALRYGVDEVVPVGILGRKPSPGHGVRRNYLPFAQGLDLAVSGLVAVLREDDGPGVWKDTCSKADLVVFRAVLIEWRLLLPLRFRAISTVILDQLATGLLFQASSFE